MSSKVTITLTEEQLRCVRDAMDMLFRLKLGQIDAVQDALLDRIHRTRVDINDFCRTRDMVKQHLMEVEKILFPDGQYGVGSSNLTKYDNRCYEIYKVCDHALWKTRSESDQKATSWSVCADSPYMLNYSGDPKIPFIVEKHET